MKPKGKPVQVPFNHSIETEWFREFTWKERIAIFFGCNVLVQIAIFTRHNSGEFQPVIRGIISKERTAKEHVSELAKAAVEAKKPKYEVVKTPPKEDPTKAR
jgi:hypothetical protein